MTPENAARKPITNPSTETGIHLVYSRTWIQPTHWSARPMQTQQLHQMHRIPQSQNTARYIRESHNIATATLAAAALMAPLVWIGHALLHHLHIL